ncbi:Ser/Thr protein kinase RdoA (MazF antagonist) [Gelidibacter algens]|uniref:Ser/Thr protein kinase RdoA (MazF antagonist) n=1 Tax=Gelidibacter algens TaxID=49280 RepID=A0A1A7QT12_9FLAO|nr:phosphotransferase [Gelidibacter algens]OBX23155.1 homoserine kinase [Gelidibacter algens]RAJ27612.1 Ser/Thr protein kinase RdoA (MazF antagonist) [Gelidibacter algens]
MSTFQVTASILSQTELGEFVIAQYGLTSNYVCKLFRTGMNHTYFISNTEKAYVIRVYSHDWRSKSEITEEIKLLNLLKDTNLNVSYPIQDINGEFIQEMNAPEGIRHLVVFSFAEGEKIRFMDKETCFSIGSFMANFHKATSNKTINRISYDRETLIELPYHHLQPYFSEKLPEMEFIKEIGAFFQKSDFENTRIGVVHMDIWYDNMAVTDENDITLFDFDFCGNGAQILDVGYFCKQLFHIEPDKHEYELKVNHFLEGYHTVRPLSSHELNLIPKAGLAVYVFYMGVQAQRFDWSNIFLTENYLKMFHVARLKSWMAYNNMEKVS